MLYIMVVLRYYFYLLCQVHPRVIPKERLNASSRLASRTGLIGRRDVRSTVAACSAF